MGILCCTGRVLRLTDEIPHDRFNLLVDGRSACDYRKLSPHVTGFFEGRCGFRFGGSSVTVAIVPGLQGVAVRDFAKTWMRTAKRSLFARSEMSVASLLRQRLSGTTAFTQAFF